jgi:hypothetical protein
MNPRHNHRQVLNTDLLHELVLRLDVLLEALDRSSTDFAIALRPDSPETSRTTTTLEEAEAQLMHPSIANALKHRRISSPRTTQQLLLDLHALHARLAGLIVELELALDLADEEQPETDEPFWRE